MLRSPPHAGRWGLAALCLLLTGATAWTQETPASVLERLEKLERQNELLQRRLAEVDPAPVDDDKNPKDPAKSADKDGPKSEAKKDASKDEKKADKKDAKKDEPNEFIVGENMKFDTAWRNGLFFTTPDKSFKLNIGGTVQFDMGWYAAKQEIVTSVGALNNYIDPNVALSDGMDFRRARLRFSGTLYEVIDYFAQYEFANSIDLRRRSIGVNTPTVPTIFDTNPGEGTLFNEVWLGISQIPVLGSFKAGHHREALNFVTGTADRNQVWMERGLLFDAFNGDYNFACGLTLDNTYFDGRAYYWLGFFQNNSRSYSVVGDGNYVYDVRLTCLPVWEEESCELWVHLGADYSYRNLTQNQTRMRARPMIRVGTGFQVPSIYDTGILFSRDNQQIANLEFASAWGRWTLGAEAAMSWVNNAYTGGLPDAKGKLAKGSVLRGDYVGTASYVELLYFLTPDHREYRKDRPGYERVAPRENYFFVDGEDGWQWAKGAWEVGMRYDYLDLINNGVNGGMGNAVTACVNWYMNANARIQWNYTWMSRHFAPSDTLGRVNGDLQALGVRFNIDF